ncbi:hypothetical protein [Microviridae sp.]|nr:hypothetical protein [Microviridae sp.]
MSNNPHSTGAKSQCASEAEEKPEAESLGNQLGQGEREAEALAGSKSQRRDQNGPGHAPRAVHRYGPPRPRRAKEHTECALHYPTGELTCTNHPLDGKPYPDAECRQPWCPWNQKDIETWINLKDVLRKNGMQNLNARLLLVQDSAASTAAAHTGNIQHVEHLIRRLN